MKGKKRILKRAYAVLFSMALVIGIMQVPGTNMLTEVYAEPADNGYTTDSYGIMTYQQKSTTVNGSSSVKTFDIQGKYSGSFKQTTYSNAGYETILTIDGIQGQAFVNALTSDYETITIGTDSSIKAKINLEFTNNGQTLRILYHLKNTADTAKKISLASGADVQIGSNDSAEIRKFSDGSGFEMLEGGSVGTGDSQFNFFGKGYKGVTDVDGFWYGRYSSRSSNYFSSVTQNTLTGTDSGCTWHWSNKTIPANSERTFSVLIGIGDAESASAAKTYPVIVNGGKTGNEEYAFSKGETVTIQAVKADSEDFTGWINAENASDVSLASSSAMTTTFVMPAHAVTFTAGVNHSFSEEYTVDREPNCLLGEAGRKSKHCLNAGCLGTTDAVDIPAVHDPEEERVLVQAGDCTHDAVYNVIQTCKVCGDEVSRTQERVPGAHDFTGAPALVDWADDYSKATLTLSCENCNRDIVLTDDSIDTTTTATCTMDGETTYKAVFETDNETVAVKEYETTINTKKMGHYFTHHAKIDPTCVATGNIEYWSCSNCDKNFLDKLTYSENEVSVEDTVIPVATIGHHGTMQKTEKVDPTCVTTGTAAYYTCSLCDNKFITNTGVNEDQTSSIVTDEDIVIPVVEHTLSTVNSKISTCAEAGNKRYFKCSVCEKVFKDITGQTETTVEDMQLPKKAHSMDENTEAHAATCTANGNNAYWTCEICGEDYLTATGYEEDGITSTVVTNFATQVILPKLGHDYQNTVKEGNTNRVSEATCTEKAVYKKVCSRCDRESAAVFEEGDPLGHSFTHHAKVDETCTGDGVEAYEECSRCHKLYSDDDIYGTDDIEAPIVIPAKGHSFTNKSVQDETTKTQAQDCTHALTYKFTCANDGCAVIAPTQTYTVGEAANHNYNVSFKWNASHTQCVATFKCAICEDEKTITVSYGDEEYSTETNSSGVKDCENDQTKTIYKAEFVPTFDFMLPSQYGKKYVATDQIKANTVGHIWKEERTIGTPATCEAAGEEYTECEKCGKKKDITYPGALGHSFTNYVIDTVTSVADGTKAPTCTEDGTKTAICDRTGCNEKDTLLAVGSAKGHSWEDDFTIDEKYCDRKGSKSVHCSECSATKYRTDVEATGHDFATYVYNNDATCLANGTKIATCANGCGAQDTVEATNTQLDHSYVTYVSDHNATCLVNGTKTATCEYGCQVGIDTVVDKGTKLGHSFTKYITNEDGTMTAVCDREDCEVTDTVGVAVEVATDSVKESISENEISKKEKIDQTTLSDEEKQDVKEFITQEVEDAKEKIEEAINDKAAEEIKNILDKKLDAVDKISEEETVVSAVAKAKNIIDENVEDAILKVNKLETLSDAEKNAAIDAINASAVAKKESIDALDASATRKDIVENIAAVLDVIYEKDKACEETEAVRGKEAALENIESKVNDGITSIEGLEDLSEEQLEEALEIMDELLNQYKDSLSQDNMSSSLVKALVKSLEENIASVLEANEELDLDNAVSNQKEKLNEKALADKEAIDRMKYLSEEEKTQAKQAIDAKLEAVVASIDASTNKEAFVNLRQEIKDSQEAMTDTVENAKRSNYDNKKEVTTDGVTLEDVKVIGADEGKNYTVSIQAGNTTLDSAQITGTGSVDFNNLPDGVYNLVVKDDATGFISTKLLDVTNGEATVVGSLNVDNKQTTVDTTGSALDVAVANIDGIYNTDVFTGNADAVGAAEDGSVEIRVSVTEPESNAIKARLQAEADEDAENAGEEEKVLSLFTDLSVDLLIKPNSGEQTTVNIPDTEKLLLIAIPLTESQMNRTGYVMYREHEGQIQELEYEANANMQSSTKECFFVKGEYAYVWAHLFSTYALGYDRENQVAPRMIQNPVGISVNENQIAVFNAIAEGTGTLKYTWERSSDGGKTWAVVEGENTPTLRVYASLSVNGFMYRCKVRNTAGEVVSNAAKLTISIAGDTTSPLSKEEETVISTTVSQAQAEQVIAATNTDNGDPEGTSFFPLQLKAVGKNNGIKLTWKKVAGADGYILYGAMCGKPAMEYVTTIEKGNATSYTVTGLNKGTYYKYIIAAYKNVAGEKRIIAESLSAHATTNGGKRGNATSIKLNKKKLAMKKGKSAQLKATYKMTKKVQKHIGLIRYTTTNPAVATVTQKGKVKAVGKGKCEVWVYTQNGCCAKVKVTVK